MTVSKTSAINCIKLIQSQDIDLNHHLIGKNSQGEIFLREKPFFEKHFGIGKGLSNREGTEFPKLVESALVMLSLLRSEPELRNHSKCAETAEKIYNTVNKVISAGHSQSLDETTTYNLKRIESHYTTLKHDLDKSPHAPRENQDSSPSTATHSTSPEPTSSNEIVPVASRAALCHQEISSLVNTGLHILAHIPAYRHLLDPERNPLRQRKGESFEAFSERQNAQRECHLLLEAILRGDSIDPNAIIEKLNQAFSAMRDPDMQSNASQKGHFIDFIHATMKLCGTPHFKSPHVTYVNHKMLQNPETLQKSLERWQANTGETLPEVVILRNDGDSIQTYYPEITLGGATYRLEAIEEEEEIEGGIAHSLPWARTENGDFARFNDLSTMEPNIVSKKGAARLLRERTGWTNAHYGRVDSHSQLSSSSATRPNYPTLDQIAAYQILLNTPLERRPNESDASFEARQDAQQAMLSNPYSDPAGVIAKMNRALTEMGVEAKVRLEGGRAIDSLTAVMHICGNHPVWSVTAQGLTFSGKSLEKWQEKNNTQELPQAIRVVNAGGASRCSPMVRISGAMYRLNVIEGRSSSLWTRNEADQFVKHATNETTLVEEREVADLVNQESEGWGAAHYVRIN